MNDGIQQVLNQVILNQKGLNIDPSNKDIFDIKSLETDEQSTFQMILPLLLLSGVGGILTSILYILYQYLKQLINEIFFSSITIDNDSPLFFYIQKYLMIKGYLQIDRMTNLQAVHQQESTWREECGAVNKKDKKDVEFQLNAGGLHMFNYNGTNIIFQHIIGRTLNKVGTLQRPKKLESIQLRCYGLWGSKIEMLKQLCQDAADFVENTDDDNLRIFAKHEYMTAFKEVQRVKNRKLDTVILDQNIADDIIQDIQRFQQSQSWYEERGVPYRRGYLLWGPPGTGKTSFIKAVASACQLSICYLNLSSGQVDDDILMQMLEKAPQKTIITLEDIDALFKDRESQQNNQRNISFSGLLNALDGIRSQEGRIVFMTTNHIEKLDPAILRPGRSDLKIQLNYASSNQIKRFFLKFYPGEEKLAEEFTRQIPEYKLSMAKLQGHFLKQEHRSCPQLAVQNAKQLIDDEIFMKDISVGEWLWRLGMLNYLPNIFDNNIHSLMDLKIINKVFVQVGITDENHKNRIQMMLKGEQDVKNGFQYLSKYALRQLVSTYIQDQKLLEQILSKLKDNKHTEWQIREALYPVIQILRRITVLDRVNLMLQIQNLMEINKPEQAAKFLNDEIEKQKKILKEEKLKNIQVKEILSKEQYEKFEEKIGDETEFFLNLTINQLEKDLEIKDYKQRQKLFEKIQKFKNIVEDEYKDYNDLFDEDKQQDTLNQQENDLIQKPQLTKQKSVMY